MTNQNFHGLTSLPAGLIVEKFANRNREPTYDFIFVSPNFHFFFPHIDGRRFFNDLLNFIFPKLVERVELLLDQRVVVEEKVDQSPDCFVPFVAAVIELDLFE